MRDTPHNDKWTYADKIDISVVAVKYTDERKKHS